MILHNHFKKECFMSKQKGNTNKRKITNLLLMLVILFAAG